METEKINIISNILILDELSENDDKKYNFLLSSNSYNIIFFKDIISLFISINQISKIIIINTDSYYLKENKILVLEYILKIRTYFPECKVLIIGKHKIFENFNDSTYVLNLGGINKTINKAI